MKNIFTAVLCLFMFSTAFAQTSELEAIVDEGIKLYDEGDYEGALDKYKQALKIDVNSPLVNYEMASTYYALKKYDKAIDHCDKVIKAKKQYIDQAYILKGTVQDVSGKPAEAIKTYRKGIKSYPNSHLLHYNLALTLYNSKQYEDAEESLRSALKAKASHASSHLLLGYVMIAQENRIKSVLALYNFLLLEPESKRSTSAFQLLKSQLTKGVSRDGNNTTITISAPAKGKGEDDFTAAELMISLLEASKNLEGNEGKSESQLFYENTNSLFKVLGELKDKNKGFWWDFYVDFFYSMSQKEHVEAFSYYISQSGNQDSAKWLEENKTKFDDLSKWYSETERKM